MTAAHTHPVEQPLRHKRVAFTGRLAAISREQARRLVAQAGGELVENVSRRLSRLVVGAGGWPLLPDGAVSRKLQRVEEWNQRGHGIRITPELEFLELVGAKERPRDGGKTQTADEICRLLALDHATLRRWEQLSLVRSDSGRYDFRDIVSLRTLAELVAGGARPEVIGASLRSLAAVLPDVERPLAQLKIVMENARTLLAEIGERLMAPDGQLLLNFTPLGAAPLPTRAAGPALKDSADAWLERGAAFEESERYADAAEAYRRAVRLRPEWADPHFNLGNALRELGQLEQAAEAYEHATRLNAESPEAWYNLADIMEQRGETTTAVTCLQRAIERAPHYADAHYNLALCMEKLGRTAEAAKHWRRYLQLDPAGEASDAIRRRLLLSGARDA